MSAARIAIQRASRAAHIPSDRKLRRWARAVLPAGAEVTLRFVAAAEGRRLNREFRGKDYATNVLSFPYEADGRRLQGDVVICAPVTAREAREQNKEVESHYAHLVIHGLLHLRGFDHESDAGRMEARERRLLARLGYADPY